MEVEDESSGPWATQGKGRLPWGQKPIPQNGWAAGAINISSTRVGETCCKQWQGDLNRELTAGIGIGMAVL